MIFVSVNLTTVTLFLATLNVIFLFGSSTKNIEQDEIHSYSKISLNQRNTPESTELTKLFYIPLEHTQLELYKSIQADTLLKSNPIILLNTPENEFTKFLKIQDTESELSKRLSMANTDIDHTQFVFPILETITVDRQSQAPQVRLNSKQKNTIVNKTVDKSNKLTTKPENNNTSSPELNLIGYWQTVHSIESKQGKLMYRPRNKSRSCTYTSGPCGHHQLTVKALKDICCHSKQCRKDRLDYDKSLKLSKKLLALNQKRLKKNGISKLEDYQKYLIHQQGANGIKNIIAATKGEKELSKNIKKNMANNSPYSYKQLKRMGSKVAAKRFMQHWENKWTSEKYLILASQPSRSTDDQINAVFIPTFDESELYLAFNMKF